MVGGLGGYCIAIIVAVVIVIINKKDNSCSLLPVGLLPQGRPVHSRWLALSCGLDFRWRSDCFPGFTLTHSTLARKLFFLSVQGSGALLSSYLEEALYKSP